MCNTSWRHCSAVISGSCDTPERSWYLYNTVVPLVTVEGLDIHFICQDDLWSQCLDIYVFCPVRAYTDNNINGFVH